MSQDTNILVNEGHDPSHLVIAFTGFKGKLMMQPYDFFSTTGLLGYSRILLRDPRETCYLRGAPPDAPSFSALTARLKAEISRLAPQTIVCVGTSGGGFTALLMGSILGVDQVHAFGPAVYTSLGASFRNKDWEQLRERWWTSLALELVLPRSVKPLMDLRQVLNVWNGRTSYTIHVCENHAPDMKRAEYLRGCPHVTVSSYGCRGHSVARYLVRQKKLSGIFRDIAVLRAGPAGNRVGAE